MAFSILLTFLAIAIARVTAAQSSVSLHDVAPHISDFDLDADFIRGALSDNLKQTLNLIDKAETLPSCGKIATSALLHSCSALEGSIVHDDSQLPAGSDLLIQEESDIYAARLAVCELSGADFSVPGPCRSFVPTPDGKRSNSIRGWLFKSGSSKPRSVHEYYHEVTGASLKQCRKALGSSGQAWTSYSNNRQNAVAMCHAMQSAVERDESRHIAKILTHTAAATGESLQDAFEQVKEIKQQFHDLRTAMPQFQNDLATFDLDLQQRVQEYWNQLDHARTGLESLTSSIDHAQSGMKEARDHLDAVLRSHLPELGHAIATASQQVKDSSVNAATSSELVAYRVQRMEHDFIARLDAAGYGLAAINDIMPQLSEAMHTIINNTLELYQAATHKQLELIAAQNATMDGMERMHQKTVESNALADSLHSNLNAVATLVDLLAGSWMLLREYVVIVALSTVFGLLNFAYWHERLRIVGCLAATVACISAFAGILIGLWPSFAARAVTSTQCSLFITLVSADLAVVLPFMVALSYFLCPKSLPSLPTDDYDPFSPPTGMRAWWIWLQAWAVWLWELTPLGWMLKHRSGSSSEKSGVRRWGNSQRVGGKEEGR